MKKDRAKRITMYIDAEVYKEFQILALKKDKSVSELVEQFMKQEVEKWEKGE
jgi:predicted HicB family RNase H-like nuclease